LYMAIIHSMTAASMANTNQRENSIRRGSDEVKICVVYHNMYDMQNS